MSELADLYESVKPLFLLAEYYNKENGIVLSSMNEIRAAFDHAMRLMKRDSDKGIDDEFDKAQGHLFRAAYDACELITLDRLEFIGRMKRNVPYDAIEKLYPDYTTKVLPLVSRIKREAVDVRQIPDTKERLEAYSNLIYELIECTEDLEKIAPAISAYKRNREFESIFSSSFISIVFGAILAVVTLFTFLWPDIKLWQQALTGLAVALFCFWTFVEGKRKRGDDD